MVSKVAPDQVVIDANQALSKLREQADPSGRLEVQMGPFVTGLGLGTSTNRLIEYLREASLIECVERRGFGKLSLWRIQMKGEVTAADVERARQNRRSHNARNRPVGAGI